MDQLLSADDHVREIRRRVKNSLQLIASILSAQARESRDEALVGELRDAVSRIVAVAHLHENLQNESEDIVHADDYLRDICNDLALTAGSGRSRSGVHVHADAVRLPGPDGLALGLITNELVANALQHAYPDGTGPVEVMLASNEDSIVLTVADRGVGRFGACERLGLTFVRLLTQKLHGQLEISDAATGTSVRLTFPGSRPEAMGHLANAGVGLPAQAAGP